MATKDLDQDKTYGLRDIIKEIDETGNTDKSLTGRATQPKRNRKRLQTSLQETGDDGGDTGDSADMEAA